MIDKITEFLTNKIRKEMPEVDDERAEVINYGLQILLGEVPKFFIMLLIAYALGLLKLSLITFFIIMPYRMFSGGFHLHTHIGCIISTCTFYCGVAFLSKIILLNDITKYVLVLCVGAGTSAMFANAVKEGAKETGFPVDATASAYGNHYDILKNYDVVVLSPQVQAHLEEVKQDAKEGTKVIATKGAQYIQLTRDPKGAVEFIVEQEKEG